MFWFANIFNTHARTKIGCSVLQFIFNIVKTFRFDIQHTHTHTFQQPHTYVHRTMQSSTHVLATLYAIIMEENKHHGTII